MRLYIKGGAWKNTEDEVLKAAVMKYGKNQWARVASLLNRKSAKQCKARWEEWLDPNIKKTEWTREEEEKLLHLAKIMPTQWRTIAPIVGRTASQCIEHYERLLDQAQERDKDYNPADDPRRLKPGEIDPNPESKPAKPDAVNMDEDEKEMLSEARARLANTKGKKAKRKAREKQLEEARRLTSLQKKRELKAAGIILAPSRYRYTKQKKNKELDFNKEDPYFKKPPPGFFDTTDEQIQSKQEASAFSKEYLAILKSQADNKPNEEKKEKSGKKDLPDFMRLAEQKARNPPPLLQNKSKLVLPKPQISDKELEEIGKLGLEAKKAAFITGSATDKLLTSYNATPSITATPYRTPRTPATIDTIKLSAQNLLALQNQQTPLKGGENIALNAQFNDFHGITPSKTTLPTPNPLATPMATPGIANRGKFMTPLPGTMSTPLRDELHINSENEILDAAAYAEKQKQQFMKNQLISKLRNLPAPFTNATLHLETNVPDEEEDELMKDITMDDIGEMRRMREMQRKERERLRLNRRSQPVKRNLPRPSIVDMDFKSKHVASLEDLDAADLISHEMINLINYDAILYPLEPSKKKKKTSHASESFENLPDETIQQAREMLAIENAKFKSPPFDIFSATWDKCHEKLLPADEKILEQIYAEENSKSQKLLSKVSTLTNGYMKKCEALQKQLEGISEEIKAKSLELQSFIALNDLERNAMNGRELRLTEEVQDLRMKEKSLQNRYRELLVEKQSLENQLALNI